MHGIQTLVCIPMPNGVLELGSSDLITEDWSLVQFAKSILAGNSGINVFNPTNININNSPNFYKQNNNSEENHQLQMSTRDSFGFLDIGIMPSGSDRHDSSTLQLYHNKQPETSAKKELVTGNCRFTKNFPFIYTFFFFNYSLSSISFLKNQFKSLVFIKEK